MTDQRPDRVPKTQVLPDESSAGDVEGHVIMPPVGGDASSTALPGRPWSRLSSAGAHAADADEGLVLPVRFVTQPGAPGAGVAIRFLSAADERLFLDAFLTAAEAAEDDDTEGQSVRSSAAGLSIATLLLLGGAGTAAAMATEPAPDSPAVSIDPLPGPPDPPTSLPDTAVSSEADPQSRR